MTTPTREQVIEWAKEAGIDPHDMCEDPRIAVNNLDRLCTFAMSAGREQGLREAKEVCEQNAKRWPDLRGFYVANECAAAIEQLRAQPQVQRPACGSAATPG